MNFSRQLTFQDFLEARRMHKAAKEAAHKKKVELHNLGLRHDQIQKHPEYVRLETESMRLYRERERLSVLAIQVNLKLFGLEDLTVIGQVMTSSHEETGQRSNPMPLSEMCCLNQHGLAELTGGNSREAMSIDVFLPTEDGEDSEKVGRIDCDGIFRFHEAPDLRTALGWTIATDAGREGLVECALEALTNGLIESIWQGGDTSRDTFFEGPFAETIRKTVSREVGTSRFGDGYCGAKNLLWQIGTLEALDERHPGYTFGY